MAEGVEAVFTDEPTWIVDPIGKLKKELLGFLFDPITNKRHTYYTICKKKKKKRV